MSLWMFPSHDRIGLTRKSFKMLRQWAGVEFDFYVADNGSDREMRKYLREEKSKGNIHKLIINDENMGQNIAANMLLDEMSDQYEWIMRWDPDALPRSRRFLKKLIRCANAIEETCILAPEITKLKHPQPSLGKYKYGDWIVDVVEILGGICRLHPSWMFSDFRFNEYAALGFGEALEIADQCTRYGMGMIRVNGLEVEHAYGEDGQKELYPEQFGWEKEVSRYVGYGL